MLDVLQKIPNFLYRRIKFRQDLVPLLKTLSVKEVWKKKVELLKFILLLWLPQCYHRVVYN